MGPILFYRNPDLQIFRTGRTKRPVAAVAVVSGNARIADEPICAVAARPASMRNRKCRAVMLDAGILHSDEIERRV